MTANLGYYDNLTQKSFAGLLPWDGRFWHFTGALPQKGRYSSAYNILYFGALNDAADMFELAGAATKAAELRKKAERISTVIKTQFISADGRIYGALDASGAALSGEDIISYALAVLFDLSPEHNIFWITLLEAYTRQCIPLSGKTPRPFNFMYIFEALEKSGRDLAILDCISRCWKAYLDAGFTTTTEGWPDDNNSCCHAWNAHPVKFLLRIIGGIRQTAPGWEQIRFAPVFCCEQAGCMVPTPYGNIVSSWQQIDNGYAVELTTPKEIKVEYELPTSVAANLKHVRTN